jgi:hypothetical protein
LEKAFGKEGGAGIDEGRKGMKERGGFIPLPRTPSPLQTRIGGFAVRFETHIAGGDISWTYMPLEIVIETEGPSAREET